MCVFFTSIQPQAGADNPLGTKILWQQKGLFSLPICCNFQTDAFEIWFYTFFNDLIYVYTQFLMYFHKYLAQGRGRQPFVDKIQMSTERP